MRFSNSFWNVSPALLATAALIMVTGVAGAIFDSIDDIAPDSPKYDGSAGYVAASGSNYSTGVSFQCVDTDNDFRFGCDSNHPDSVSISTNQGKVNQKKNDNNADAYLNVATMGGLPVNLSFPLVCDRVQMKGKSNDSNDKIQAQCNLKKCDIPGDLTVAQLQSASACIEGSEDDGSLGKSVTTLQLDNNNQLKGKITSKGIRQPGS